MEIIFEFKWNARNKSTILEEKNFFHSFMSNLDIEDYVNLNTVVSSIQIGKQIGKDKERTEQSTKHPRVVGNVK